MCVFDEKKLKRMKRDDDTLFAILRNKLLKNVFHDPSFFIYLL